MARNLTIDVRIDNRVTATRQSLAWILPRFPMKRFSAKSSGCHSSFCLRALLCAYYEDLRAGNVGLPNPPRTVFGSGIGNWRISAGSQTHSDPGRWSTILERTWDFTPCYQAPESGQKGTSMRLNPSRGMPHTCAGTSN